MRHYPEAAYQYVAVVKVNFEFNPAQPHLVFMASSFPNSPIILKNINKTQILNNHNSVATKMVHFFLISKKKNVCNLHVLQYYKTVQSSIHISYINEYIFLAEKIISKK